MIEIEARRNSKDLWGFGPGVVRGTCEAFERKFARIICTQKNAVEVIKDV